MFIEVRGGGRVTLGPSDVVGIQDVYFSVIRVERDEICVDRICGAAGGLPRPGQFLPLPHVAGSDLQQSGDRVRVGAGVLLHTGDLG